ncbi:hypothetical protein RRG08_047168 [Elysia crispata]|uniref:Uncharacterized protein n=1 Tax=Elysia crispata TaxID=231223 RepID=A0AAE0YNE4_9GAST|nr:hypothetical protein RRG08_047168 [Elysia crispata]
MAVGTESSPQVWEAVMFMYPSFLSCGPLNIPIELHEVSSNQAARVYQATAPRLLSDVGNSLPGLWLCDTQTYLKLRELHVSLVDTE